MDRQSGMTCARRARLLIIQPYIAEYRVPFYEALHQALGAVDIDLAVASGRSTGAQAARRDDRSASATDWPLRERVLTIGSKELIWRSTGGARRAYRPDLIVVEQAIKNLESWQLILGSRRSDSPRVGMWGHGRQYSTTQSRAEASLKQWLTGRTDWFFSYTQRGADHVVNHGFPRSRVTVVQNSTDTSSLIRDLAKVTSQELSAFYARNGLTPGRIGLFIGGVDQRKGITFLLSAASAIRRRVPGFRLLIAGSGNMEAEVSTAAAAGAPVVYLGRIEGKAKALALAASSVILNPEWVGLIAVDALASGIPLVTTNHSSHSPEFEFLEDGETAVVTDHRVDSFADAVSRLMVHEERLSQLSRQAKWAGRFFSIEEMARRFSEGVALWVGSSTRVGSRI